MGLRLKMIWIVCLVAVLVLIGLVWLCWGNTTLEISFVEVADAGLPEAFDGLRIVHISDLHNTVYGAEQSALLAAVAKCQPDLIAVTGDLIDSYQPNVAVSMAFMRGAVRQAPVFYVPGNHESRLPAAYALLKQQMRAVGVTVVENDSVDWAHNGAVMQVSGVMDPAFRTGRVTQRSHDEAIMVEQLERVVDGTGKYTLLLSHRPELFDAYCGAGVNLVLCGHAHGGQVRFPGGGVFAPHQGLLPRYTEGHHTDGTTHMVISRGLKHRWFPPRINNRPEIVAITLKTE